MFINYLRVVLLSNLKGNVVVGNCPAESKVTVAEQTGQWATGRLKLSRTSLPTTSKTRIQQNCVHSASLYATKQPPSSAQPITGGMHESKIPIRIGKFDHVVFKHV